MNAVAPSHHNTLTAPPIRHTSLTPNNMSEALQLAEFMSRARTVPKHLQDSPGDCLMVVELAMRWGMSPFAVAQATSVISGKIMIEGKLVAAAVENSGAIVGHLDYEYSGEGEGRAITVSATRRGETNPRTVIVTFKEARTDNAMWKRQPDQQLVYHGARVWARRWTPAVILGVYSREEMGPIIEGEMQDVTLPPGNVTLREAINAEVPMRAAAAATPRAPRVTEKQAAVYEAADPLDEQDGNVWLQNLKMELANAQTRDEVVKLADHPSVNTAQAKAPHAIRRDISKLLSDAYKRFAEPAEDLSDEALGEVEIKGEEKVMSG